MNDKLKKKIDEDIANNRVIVYIKGTRLSPSCGFSLRVVSILDRLGIKYTVRNVLEEDNLRSAMKEYSNWPTFPQLYVDGQFIGGCDIVEELHEKGKLTSLLQS